MGNKKFNKLSAEYLEHGLTGKDLEEFVVLLEKSSELRKTFQKEIRLQVLMRNAAVEELNLISEKGEEFISDRRKAAVRSRPRFPRIVWISIAACLIIMAGAYFYNIYQMHQIPRLIKARIMERQGKVLIERQGTEKIIDVIDDREMEIHAGDVIQTGPQAYAVIEYTDEDTRAELSHSTAVSVDEHNRCKVMELTRGRIDLRVAGQLEGGGLQVITPHVHADVAGTVFSVDVSTSPDTQAERSEKADPQNSELLALNSELTHTRVQTYQGKVRVARREGGSSIMLTAGHYVAVTGSDDRKLEASDISGWAGIRKGPDGEILRTFRWDLLHKGPQGLKPRKGSWEWKKYSGKPYGGMIIEGKKDVIVTLPVILTGKPFKVFLRVHCAGGRREVQTRLDILPGFMNALIPLRQWSCKTVIPWKYTAEMWVNGMRSMRAMRAIKAYGFPPGGVQHLMREYVYAPRVIHIIARNVGIQALEIREVASEELPEPLRSQRAWNALKKNMQSYYETPRSNHPENGKTPDKAEP